MKPEALQKKSSKKSSQPRLEYQSNPFSLSFNKFGLFFEKNLGWAIALLVIPIFLGIMQFGSQMPWLLEPETSGPTSSVNRDDRNMEPSYSTNLKQIDSDKSEINEDDIPPTGVVVLIVSIVILVIIGLIVLQLLIQTFVVGALTFVALENDAGRKASLSGAIDAVVARFRRLFLAQMLATLKIFGWTLLFIIPGIIAVFRYTLLPFVIMDESPKKRDIKSSHDRVKAIVSGRKREVFGIATVATIIPIIGAISQYVGNAALYRQLQVYKDQNSEKPPIHWLNYFGFFLIGIYLLFVAALVALFIAFEATS